MAAGPVQIVEHAQQLAHHRGLGPVGGGLLSRTRPLAVVGELRLAPAAGRRSARRPRRPAARLDDARQPASGAGPLGAGPGGRSVAHLAGLGIDAPLVGDGHRLVLGSLDVTSSPRSSRRRPRRRRRRRAPDRSTVAGTAGGLLGLGGLVDRLAQGLRLRRPASPSADLIARDVGAGQRVLASVIAASTLVTCPREPWIHLRPHAVP